ncbi:MAG TPA: BatA domain-containing protein [Vicinamibacterales bacterium]|nr:BatA domain-containing protein [Vicinamibacterales bacterium]
MIGWLNPAALWGLLLLAGPLAIHLLRIRQARRVRFPSLRFVASSRTADVRLRLPSDLALLLLRMGIVSAAVYAAAAPVLLTPSRVASWNARIARAVVLDTSDSMRAGVAVGRTAAETAEAEAREAGESIRIETPDLGDGLRRACGWLATARPARLEIVVISDFQQGAIADRDLSRVPAHVGLRLVQVGEPLAARRTPGMRLAGGPGIAPRTQELEVSGRGTRTTFVARAAEDAGGLRLVTAPGPGRDAAILLRTVATAGAPAPDGREPIVVRLGNVKHEPGIVPEAVRDPWMLRTLLRLRQDETLARLTREADTDARFEAGSPWVTVVDDGQGAPVMRAAAAGPELVVDVAASPDSLFAAAAVRAVLTARHGPFALPEFEPRRLSAAQLSAASRSPEGVERGAWRQAESSDARWFWTAALVLIGIEQYLRDRRLRATRKDFRAAA